MDRFSFLGSANGAFVEEVYEQYLVSPDAVQPSWRSFFQGYDFAREVYGEVAEEVVPESVTKEFRVLELIDGYRTRGHLFTKTNPVRERRKYSPTLALENFGLSSEDLDTIFQAGTEVNLGAVSLKNIVQHLEGVYCQSIGVEFMYIREVEEREWIKNRLHKNGNEPNFQPEQKKQILRKLNQAVAFESFLHTKYVGQKRFSLEGAESTIPALDALIEKGAELGADEFVVGMAHRGRLNVLTNIFNKTYRDIFTEFEGKEFEEALFDGDVKYHLGYTSSVETDTNKKVEITLAPNPSHLEAVGPVVEGIVRAKINHKYNRDVSKVVPILIHGDAAVAGQGVVYEVLQMAQLDGYGTGGTIHLVINNQIGFTTNYLDARSSTYCTDVAKTTLCPVMHINGDDVEAVVHAVEFAIEYRQRYGKDVFLDLLCYRKYGHNEGDEPRFTQPLLYKAIATHANPREIYNQKLMADEVVGANIVKEMEAEFKAMLEENFGEAKRQERAKITPFLAKEWEGKIDAQDSDFDSSPETGMAEAELKNIAKTIYTLPEGKNIFKKTQKLLADRQRMIEETNSLDWGMAELMAYGSLLTEGHSVRISGQDVERGTFSHRHAILKVEDSEEEICLLNEIGPEQAQFSIYNSFLSEYGVVGFDYGYAMATPDSLTVWEAQFGDFSNGCQIIIDQFISAAEDKWKVQNGLVMLLPHGYEGQGAEHSSARMERYLQMCAENNMQMANVTTPANFFHLIRRQLKRDFRKPLVVFSPKSLLRHAKCVSPLEDLVQGKFQELIDDTTVIAATKVVMVSGKLYYELIEERKQRGLTDVAIVRMEQLYPMPEKAFAALVEKYGNDVKWIWAQEEPENMGAWSHILRHWRHIPWQCVARSASAAPASGSSTRAAARQAELIGKVFEI
jgi:2-oxoglutarate dehydrogenase E1 component